MIPSIEVVIPVHDPARPLERSLQSILAQRTELAALGVELGATVVCHNIAVEAIKDSVTSAQVADDAVTWLGHNDGTRSPAGPRNAALDRSAATFLSFLDSDDYLEEGSLAAWWKVAEARGAAAVIAPLRTPEGTILRSPRIRPSKPAVLDPVRDGLAYRSVPYGLLRREALLACGFRYAEGIAIGEDLEAALRLWFRGGRIAYPYSAPAYHQTDESGDTRVTSAVRPLAEEFLWLDALVQTPWISAATAAERRTIALKLLRVHGIGALVRRGSLSGSPDTPVWSEADRTAWAKAQMQLLDLAGGSLPALSRRDAALCRSAAMAHDESQLRAAVVRYNHAGRLDELAPENPLSMFSADSVLRHYVAERLRTKSGVFALR
ncbi:glycosyltransferase [Arthrobacter sp. ok362]|uniref:glycosyltransferase family 2 protein n=1 Tax=Arthrobacter sp. ok362 TaxID=1761745 RepID=UPI000884E96E|nr:glycosyltransferase [Arthrobacter sp. ok362]SDK77837.1 Glycosyltransferase, GT2 family [Arthrobacter sp. ok362]